MERRGLKGRRWPLLLPILVVYALTVLVHRVAGHSGDEGDYLFFAHMLTHGGYAVTDPARPDEYLWHGPGLPLLLAPFVATGIGIDVTRLVAGPLCLFGAILVLHQMLRDRVTDRAALVISYVAAAYLPFFAVLRMIHVEPLATLMFTLAVFFLVRAYRGGRLDAIWAGVSLALLALARVEYGYVLLIAVIASALWWVASRSRLARASLVASLVGFLLCVPWLTYTYSLTHKVFYWGNSGGLSLYWMAAPGNLGDWHDGQDLRAHPELSASRTLFGSIAQLNPATQDARLRHAAVQDIRSDPGHYLGNVVNNIDRLVFNTPYSFTNEKSGTLLYALPNALLLGFAVLAIWAGLRARTVLDPWVLPIALLVLLSIAVHVPVSAYSRFTVPIAPVIVWLIVEAFVAYRGLLSQPMPMPDSLSAAAAS